MSIKDELKPCPFCGGDAELVTWFEETEARHIRCMSCGCMTGSPHFSARFAIKEWNTRVIDKIDDDMVLVPREPTYAMCKAGDVMWDVSSRAIYKAMIEAAKE